MHSMYAISAAGVAPLKQRKQKMKLDDIVK